jgi:hypothetical protein
MLTRAREAPQARPSGGKLRRRGARSSGVQLFALVFVAVTHVVVPVGLLWWLWARASVSKFDWLARAAVVAAYVLWLYLAGRWDFLSYYARYLLAAVFVAAAVGSLLGARALPLFASGGAWWWAGLCARLAVLALFSLLVWQALAGRRYEGRAVALEYPLRDGAYYVAQGGSTNVLNYHVAAPPQTYALDLTALDRLGRKGALRPRRPEDFRVYGHHVYSPCDGEVFVAEDGLPDADVSRTEAERPAGNHLWLRCDGDDAYVILAHLMRGSLTVTAGERVRAGQRVARVGNSGNTTEPHLHLHAARFDAPPPPDSRRLLREGKPAPVLFRGRFLTRNSTF